LQPSISCTAAIFPAVAVSSSAIIVIDVPVPHAVAPGIENKSFLIYLFHPQKQLFERIEYLV
jgi:hypothetical protein